MLRKCLSIGFDSYLLESSPRYLRRLVSLQLLLPVIKDRLRNAMLLAKLLYRQVACCLLVDEIFASPRRYASAVMKSFLAYTSVLINRKYIIMPLTQI